MLRDPRRATHQPAKPRDVHGHGAYAATTVLRLVGFACNVVAATSVTAVFVLYGSVLIALALGLYAIGRGILIEPPAFIMQPFAVFTRLTQRFSQRLAPT